MNRFIRYDSLNQKQMGQFHYSFNFNEEDLLVSVGLKHIEWNKCFISDSISQSIDQVLKMKTSIFG